MSMKRAIGYYAAGIIAAIAFVIFAELIWLPASIATSSDGKQWIDRIDGLLYGLAVIPLLWGAGAWAGNRSLKRGQASNVHKRGLVLKLLRYIIISLSLAAVVLIVIQPDRVIYILGLLIADMLLIFVDMLWTETVSIRSSTVAGRRLRFPRLSLLVLLLTAVVFVVLAYPTAYRVTYPAMTMPMSRYAHVEGGSAKGSISGVLVFERVAFPVDFLYGRILPEYTFEHKSKNEPPLTEAYTQVVTMKTDANDVASAIAMQKAGIGQGVTTTGVRVVSVGSDSAAQGVLIAGDVIKQMDGREVNSVDAMTAYMIESVVPESKVSVVLVRGKEQLSVEVPTRLAEATDTTPARPVFGISVENEQHMDIPRLVQYRHYIAHIGGPSHGAMLTLALIDQLTPGGVTHGVKVAGTGTIEADGSIGLVGGIPQKAYAVSRTDAEVFFVPAKSLQAAKEAAPNLLIVPVQTIDDVIQWLAEHPKD